jgi:predicted phosphodiesterase
MAPDLNIDIWWNIFPLIWKGRLWNLLGSAYRFYRQYRDDKRNFERINILGIPFFGLQAGLPSGSGKYMPLPEFPDVLFGKEKRPDRIFSTETSLENRLRAIYNSPEEKVFRQEVDQILTEKYEGQPPTVPTNQLLSVEALGILPDKYLEAVVGMFAEVGQPPKTPLLRGNALAPNIYQYVLFGHTHDETEIKISDMNVTYINSGSWTRQYPPPGGGPSRLSYVTICETSSGEVKGEKKTWS